MISFLKKLWKDRRGNALLIAAAALPLVAGSAGLASDTIQWTLWKRQLQRAADSGALAGVYGKLAGQTVSTGNCSASTPISRDLTVGDVTNRLGATPTCAVQSPPTSGSWTASSFSAVKVTVSAQRALAFSGLFMTTAPTITASATAAVVQSGKYCVISLDNQIETGINFSGNANVNLGCGLKTNAKGTSAVDGNGSSTITASPVAAVGQIANSSNFATGTTFQPYSPPQTDPFASVNAPTVRNGCNQAALRGIAASVSASNGTVCYSTLKLTSGQTASFTDEVVILNGGDLDIGAGSTLTCLRCTFVLTTDASPVTSNSIGNVTFNGGANISLTAPGSGTYKGIVIYKDRRAPDCSNCNKINGSSTSYIEGAIYIPTQEIQFNGNSGLNSNCVQMVGWQVQFSGNTNITNTCPSGSGAKSFDGSMVRLVE
jgi:Flp pilus assembly protein TadG